MILDTDECEAKKILPGVKDTPRGQRYSQGSKLPLAGAMKSRILRI